MKQLFALVRIFYYLIKLAVVMIWYFFFPPVKEQ